MPAGRHVELVGINIIMYSKINFMKTIMKTAVVLFTVFFIFNSCDKDNDNNNNNNLNSRDKNFITIAAYANLDEIDFAQLALLRSTNDSVRNFAQRMITDHSVGITG